MMINRIFLLSALGALVLGACGGDDGDDGNANPDAGDDVDAADIDAKPNTCSILEASYGDLGSVTGSALYKPQFDDEPDGAKLLQLQIPLNTETPPDILFIELYEEAAPFEPALTTGTFTIIDLQTDVISCGTCVFIGADFDDPDLIDFHVASSGTLTIDTLDLTPDTGTIAGTLTGVNLRKVELSGGEQSNVECGCTTSVDSVAFDYNVTVPPPARQSRPERTAVHHRLRAIRR